MNDGVKLLDLMMISFDSEQRGALDQSTPLRLSVLNTKQIRCQELKSLCFVPLEKEALRSSQMKIREETPQST